LSASGSSDANLAIANFARVSAAIGDPGLHSTLVSLWQ
jgi:hypothetical protein